MTYTDSIPVLNKFLVNKFEAKKADLGIADVYYGDQERIPRTPAVCFEPGEKDRELNGAPRRTKVDITLYCLVYHNPVKAVSSIREEDDLLAEAIETEIHADRQFLDETGDPQVIDSMVTSIESGYQQKANSLFRVSRLTVEARVQIQLPSAF